MKVKKEYLILILIIAGLSVYLFVRSSGRTRSGWSAGWPVRNIHWLPRTERTLRRTGSASVWNPSRW